jgi:uncharacterized membrane protein HdeD (DUF308 family)
MLTSPGLNWWIVLTRGFWSLLFAITAFLSPRMPLTALVIVYGAYALVDGWIALALGLADGAPWWPMTLAGMASTFAGVLTFQWSGITGILLLAVIATWSILRGTAEILGGIRLRAAGLDDWRLLVSGACSIAFGAILFVGPGAGALDRIGIIASSSATFGLLTTMLALKLRSLNSAHDAADTSATTTSWAGSDLRLLGVD